MTTTEGSAALNEDERAKLKVIVRGLASANPDAARQLIAIFNGDEGQKQWLLSVLSQKGGEIKEKVDAALVDGGPTQADPTQAEPVQNERVLAYDFWTDVIPDEVLEGYVTFESDDKLGDQLGEPHVEITVVE